MLRTVAIAFFALLAPVLFSCEKVPSVTTDTNQEEQQQDNGNNTGSLKPTGSTLVVYYSFTGNCRAIVNALTASIKADVLEILPAEEGLDYAADNYAIGSSLIAAIREKPDDAASYPAIKPVNRNAADYDTIIIVTPLWWSNMAAIMQSYLFREGETGSTLIKDLTDITVTSVTLSTGTYWGEDWVAYSVNNTIELLGGRYPSFDKPAKNPLKSTLKRNLSYAPTALLRDLEHHIVIFSDGNNRTAFDFETKDYFDSRTENTVKSHWFDDYLIWYNDANKIFVQDFDGNNVREIISNVNNSFPICLSENNRWIYYFDTVIEEKETTETVDANAETGTESIIHYALKRKKLNY